MYCNVSPGVMPVWPMSVCRVAVLSRVMDLAMNSVGRPVPLKSMVVFGAVTSRESSGTH
ncbi:hypothetical protein D3C76_880960 [compost metagenome]